MNVTEGSLRYPRVLLATVLMLVATFVGCDSFNLDNVDDNGKEFVLADMSIVDQAYQLLNKQGPDFRLDDARVVFSDKRKAGTRFESNEDVGRYGFATVLISLIQDEPIVLPSIFEANYDQLELILSPGELSAFSNQGNLLVGDTLITLKGMTMLKEHIDDEHTYEMDLEKMIAERIARRSVDNPDSKAGKRYSEKYRDFYLDFSELYFGNYEPFTIHYQSAKYIEDTPFTPETHYGRAITRIVHRNTTNLANPSGFSQSEVTGEVLRYIDAISGGCSSTMYSDTDVGQVNVSNEVTRCGGTWPITFHTATINNTQYLNTTVYLEYQ